MKQPVRVWPGNDRCEEPYAACVEYGWYMWPSWSFLIIY